MKDLKLQAWPIDKVVPYELNAKNHDTDQVKRIAQSIAEFGWDQPIVVDKFGVIIKGHGRRLAALHLGMKEVPVLIRDDLTPEQVRAARLADNRVAISDIDPEMLRKELQSLEFDLTGIFDAKELEFLTADLATVNTDVFVPDVEATATKTAEATAEKAKQVENKPVTISQALGFSHVPGSAQRNLTRFMAKIEADYDLPPDKAFIKFIDSLMESV